MKRFFAFILTSTSIFAASSVFGQAPLYWDPASSGGASLGGSGVWDTNSADPNTLAWFNGTADIVWTNANNDDAYFTGTAGTVVLTNNISAGDIYFTNVTGNYVITNATGAEILNVANVIDTGGSEDTIGALIGNSGTLNKNGNGRLHLPVNNGSTLSGNVIINAGAVSVETNNGIGDGNTVTVSNGAALQLNGGAAGLSAFYPNVTINGTGITNSGSLRNLSGVTTFYGQIILGTNNSMIYVDTDAALVYDGESGPLTDNGNNYNLIISGNGTGNFQMGATSIGGTLIVEGPASCYAYLNSISPTTWNGTYIGPGAKFFVENNISFGSSANPASLITTNVIVDGGSITSGGTYTMWANDGITVTTNGGWFTNNSGTWTMGSVYSSNTPVTFTANGSSTIAIAVANTSSSVLNIGTGTLTLNGANTKLQSGTADTYSNLVINGSTFTFNYDTSGGAANLGAVPSTFCPSNIWLNGGQFHVGHSTTIAATRGIYVTPAGTLIEEVTGGGTVTIAATINGPGAVNFDGNKVVLGANNSYGATTVGSGILYVGNGGSTGTLGTGNTSLSGGGMYFNRTGTYTYGGAISGSGSITNEASGTVTLTGPCTYTGVTKVTAGTLLIDNTNASAMTVFSGGTLGGTGVFGGAITVNSGGTLALGTGTLSASNNVTLSGNVTVSVNNSASPSSGEAIVTGTLTGGSGTVTITDSGPALVAGNTFQLFSQPVSGGGSMTITGGGAGVTWNNNLAVNGTISVQSVVPSKPVIKQTQIIGGNVIISGINGTAGDTNIVLTTTNLLLPISQWTPISTNIFTGSAFSITNPIVPGTPYLFYTLQVPY